MRLVALCQTLDVFIVNCTIGEKEAISFYCQEINLILHLETKFQNQCSVFLGIQHKIQGFQRQNIDLSLNLVFNQDSNIKILKTGSFLGRSTILDQEVFLHVADPADVVGLRRKRLLVNCQGKARLTQEARSALFRCGQEEMPRAPAILWDALVQS